LFDVILRKIDGYTICDRVREQDKDILIIMLTAKSTDEYIIYGLRLCADDYVAKTFSVAQLTLRIKAVLRRSQNNIFDNQTIHLRNDACLDADNLSGSYKNKTLAFTRKKIDLLCYLNSQYQCHASR
jgi:DNA-binding response OmpR family regulator